MEKLTQQGQKRNRWLLWGGGLLLLTILISIPIYLSVMEGILASNERSASLSLKALSSAEADFRMNDRDYNKQNDFWTGDVAGLYTLKVDGERIALIACSIAEADAHPLDPLVRNPVPKEGYYFVAMEFDNSDISRPAEYRQDTDGTTRKVHNSSRFGICAYPAEYGNTGRVTFILNEAGTIWKNDNGGKPILRWPASSELKMIWADPYEGCGN